MRLVTVRMEWKRLILPLTLLLILLILFFLLTRPSSTRHDTPPFSQKPPAFTRHTLIASLHDTFLSPPVSLTNEHVTAVSSEGRAYVWTPWQNASWESECRGTLFTTNSLQEDAHLFILGDCTEGEDEYYAGIAVYDQQGNLLSRTKYWYGLVTDMITQSPHGVWVCSLITGNVDCYSQNASWHAEGLDRLTGEIRVSDTGLVVVGSQGESDHRYTLKEGRIISHVTRDASFCLAWQDLIACPGTPAWLATPNGTRLQNLTRGEPVGRSRFLALQQDEQVILYDRTGGDVARMPGVFLGMNDQLLLTMDDANILHAWRLDTLREAWNLTLPSMAVEASIAPDGKAISVLSYARDTIWILLPAE